MNNSKQDKKLKSLVAQIYDAVSEPKVWGPFLDNLAKATGAHAARMRMSDSGNNAFSLIAGAGHDSTYDQQYSDYFFKVDPWNQFLTGYKEGVIFDSQHVVPDAVFENSEIYNDLFHKYDMFYGLGGHIIRSDDIIARIGVHRSRSQGPYGTQDHFLLKTLFPHLGRAFKLSTHFHELQAKADGMESALYHSKTPLLLIDENTKVVFVSQKAESILNTGNGLSIQHNRIRLPLEAEQSLLQALLQQAVATALHQGSEAGGALRVTSGSGEQRYNLVITPYPARSVEQLGSNSYICAAIFIHDTREGGSSLSSERLKTLYELTPSETRLAEVILEGLTPAEAAERFGLSVNTTRTQLRSLFTKTNTQRQADLVKLLIGLSA